MQPAWLINSGNFPACTFIRFWIFSSLHIYSIFTIIRVGIACLNILIVILRVIQNLILTYQQNSKKFKKKKSAMEPFRLVKAFLDIPFTFQVTKTFTLAGPWCHVILHSNLPTRYKKSIFYMVSLKALCILVAQQHTSFS